MSGEGGGGLEGRGGGAVSRCWGGGGEVGGGGGGVIRARLLTIYAQGVLGNWHRAPGTRCTESALYCMEDDDGDVSRMRPDERNEEKITANLM